MKKVIVSLSVLATPFIAFAQPQVSGSVQNANALIGFLQTFFDAATILIIGGATVYVIWHAFKFVTAGGDEEARKAGQNGIIYGVIGVAVMVSVWGLINFITDTAGFDTGVGVVPVVNIQ